MTTRRLQFLVSGSSGFYEIVATRNGSTLRLTCTCTGAEFGQACKHRLALLEGVVDDLLSENEAEVALLGEMIEGTAVEQALARYREAEAALEDAKRAAKGAKRALARALGG